MLYNVAVILVVFVRTMLFYKRRNLHFIDHISTAVTRLWLNFFRKKFKAQIKVMADHGLPRSFQPGSMKTITDSKLVNFAVGQQKKTRFQKLRDEKELKKK